MVTRMHRNIVVVLLASCVIAQEALEQYGAKEILGFLLHEPLPAVTPPDVVNLLLEGSIDQPGDVVASVVAAVRISP